MAGDTALTLSLKRKYLLCADELLKSTAIDLNKTTKDGIPPLALLNIKDDDEYRMAYRIVRAPSFDPNKIIKSKSGMETPLAAHIYDSIFQGRYTQTDSDRAIDIIINLLAHPNSMWDPSMANELARIDDRAIADRLIVQAQRESDPIKFLDKVMDPKECLGKFLLSKNKSYWLKDSGLQKLQKARQLHFEKLPQQRIVTKEVESKGTYGSTDETERDKSKQYGGLWGQKSPTASEDIELGSPKGSQHSQERKKR